MSFLKGLARARPILLDGAPGAELNRRGVSTELPLWSARALLAARAALSQIHADYVRAGAEMLTANTFRAHRRSLARGGQGERAAELTGLAGGLARAAVAEAARECFVAGSRAPLGDCYSPELGASQGECER